MTNFEKWKQGLTIEDAYKHFSKLDPCQRCLASEHCGISRGMSCHDTFVEWASAEAEVSKEVRK